MKSNLEERHEAAGAGLTVKSHTLTAPMKSNFSLNQTLTEFQYRILMRIAPQPANACNGAAYLKKSKIETLLGSDIHTKIHGKTIIDFGCGEGLEAIEFAKRGAELVIGIDIREDILAIAQKNAANASVAGRCQFRTSTMTPADLIVSLDAFEHFQDPAAELREMERLLKPGGEVIAGFGPTWYHPLGGHFFSVFPWAHLLFREEALIRWRANFRTDGATKFNEVGGGLNQMRIRRFEKLVEESPFRFRHLDLLPIRKLRHFHNRATREFTTAMIRCTLVRRDTPQREQHAMSDALTRASRSAGNRAASAREPEASVFGEIRNAVLHSGCINYIVTRKLFSN